MHFHRRQLCQNCFVSFLKRKQFKGNNFLPLEIICSRSFFSVGTWCVEKQNGKSQKLSPWNKMSNFLQSVASPLKLLVAKSR